MATAAKLVCDRNVAGAAFIRKMATMTTSVPEVSVVVCVHNGARDLPNLFAALRRQTLDRERFEVILVDDASTDETAELAAREPGVQLIPADGHIGLPRARNVGMGAARAPVIALTDADTTPDDTWLELGLSRMTDSGADLLAGGITVPLDERPTISAELDAATHFDQESYVERGYGAGANLWVRTELQRRIGGFNEQLAAYGGDDNEFGQRATAAGATLVYAPDVNLAHPPRESFRALARKSYMLGYGLSAHRRHNSGPLGRTPKLYLQRHQYGPRHRMLKLERLAGPPPSGLHLLRLRLGRWLFIQLPRVYGDFRGELAYRFRRDAA